MTEKIILGGGCFWCLDGVYRKVKGVKNVVSGYAGGKTENPTYESVSNGNTGHAEVTQIEFDPNIIKLEQLLDIFWQIHDPTTLNRQGADEGTQYRSIILYSNEDQKIIAEKSLKAAQQFYTDPIVTEVKSLDEFYPAEDYHQNFYESNRNYPYCRIVIDPKVKKLFDKFDKLTSK